jgi:hypothetical protein
MLSLSIYDQTKFVMLYLIGVLCCSVMLCCAVAFPSCYFTQLDVFPVAKLRAQRRELIGLIDSLNGCGKSGRNKRRTYTKQVERIDARIRDLLQDRGGGEDNEAATPTPTSPHSASATDSVPVPVSVSEFRRRCRTCGDDECNGRYVLYLHIINWRRVHMLLQRLAMLAIIPVNPQPSSIVSSKNEHNNHTKSKANNSKNKTININKTKTEHIKSIDRLALTVRL